MQQAELATVRWQRYSLGVILFGVLAVGIALISRQRVKHRAEERILAETRAGRAAAEVAHDLKTRLLHITSHDIRGPLTNVLHVTDEMQEERRAGPARRPTRRYPPRDRERPEPRPGNPRHRRARKRRSVRPDRPH
ncbi:MAG: hypothetical protein WDM96_03605 [Lacunisphaera sp.]